MLVPKAGLEPARGVTTSDFESGASANSATSAYAVNRRRSVLLLTKDILTKSANEVNSQIDFAVIDFAKIEKFVRWLPKFPLCQAGVKQRYAPG